MILYIHPFLCSISTIQVTSNLSNIISKFLTVTMFVIVHMKTNVMCVYDPSPYKFANALLQWFICYSHHSCLNIDFARRPCCIIPNIAIEWLLGDFCFVLMVTWFHISARRPTVVTQFCNFPQSLQENSGIVALLRP